jgi:hypothetical protein
MLWFLKQLNCTKIISGSGKRALLEVISRRAQGPTRGQILLNGAHMSLRLFQQNCGYVTHKCDLLPGLTVEQTLHYAGHITTASKVLFIYIYWGWHSTTYIAPRTQHHVHSATYTDTNFSMLFHIVYNSDRPVSALTPHIHCHHM